MASAFMETFHAGVSRDAQVLNDACLACHSAFCRHMTRRLTDQVLAASRAEQLSTIPDCYVLVEGPSDVEYIEAAIELLSPQSVRMRVEDCSGKAGVRRRFRDLVQKHPYIGSVAALLDADAEKEYRELAELARSSKRLLLARIAKGDAEDCFSATLQARALNSLYGEGARITPRVLTSAGRRTASLKRALWDYKATSFDKVALARKVRSLLRTPEDIPVEIRAFAETAIRLAQQRAKVREHYELRHVAE